MSCLALRARDGIEKDRNQARKETGCGTRSFPRTGLTGQKAPSWFLARVYLISTGTRTRAYSAILRARKSKNALARLTAMANEKKQERTKKLTYRERWRKKKRVIPRYTVKMGREMLEQGQSSVPFSLSLASRIDRAIVEKTVILNYR